MEQLQNYVGKPLTFTLPSGPKITIREQNGDDDETLSAMTDGEGKNVFSNTNNFVASVVIDKVGTGEKFMTPDEAKEMRLKDKYYILFKSRIHSNGPIVTFKATCSNKNCKHEMEAEEDLSILDNDLSKYKEGDPIPEGKSKHFITPYPDKGKDGEFHQFTLPSQKTLRFKYMTGMEEEKALELYQGDSSKNTEIYLRELSIKMGNGWQKLGSLAIFSSAEMKLIRAEIRKMDSQFIMASEVDCPKCGNYMLIPLNSIQDFFYPTEI